MQQWLKQECGGGAADHTVHSLVRYKLQAKLKKPRPKSCKQNPKAIEQFKKPCTCLKGVARVGWRR